MQVFVDERMAVAVADGSTPSHAKPMQLAQLLRTAALPIEWQAVAPVAWEELEAVHDARYLRAVRTGEPPEVVAEASVVWTPELADSLRWTVGSMQGAARGAVESGCAASLSSGFHHAHYARAGTFCLVNGLVLAALGLCESSGGKPVLILDCDYHYGNGTDDILGRFVDDPTVRVRHLSLGRTLRRPEQAEQYVREINRIGARIAAGEFGGVVYQAGMDVLRGDPMGGILTYRQAYERDLRVFEACRQRDTPIAWNLAGGYQRDADGGIAPVLRGHLNTFIACARTFDGWVGLEPALA